MNATATSRRTRRAVSSADDVARSIPACRAHRLAIAVRNRWRYPEQDHTGGEMADAPASNEKPCDQKHASIEEAIHHARTRLGDQDVEPFWGGMGQINPGRVVGYQVT